MKTQNVTELNERFKDCPTRQIQVEHEGRKYIVISHFTGQKDLDDVIMKSAYSRAMSETLHP